MQLDQIKEWLETLPTWARPIVEVAAIVVASAVITLLVCLIGGWTDLISLSNALFLASAVVFVIGLFVHFGSRAGGAVREDQGSDQRGDQRGDQKENRREESPLEILRRRRRPGSRYTTIFIVAGFIIFGLSVAVGSFV